MGLGPVVGSSEGGVLAVFGFGAGLDVVGVGSRVAGPVGVSDADAL